ncbi:MAG: MFS transporter [Chloroflexi bacterium]|nr:MFS transporter [Chloroflexota bacterium]
MKTPDKPHSGLTQRLRVDVFGRFPRGIWVMAGIDTLTTIGFSISIPFLALYLHNERSISMTLVGIIFLVSGLFTAMTNLIGGMLSDRFGRQRMMITVSSIGILAYTTVSLLIGFTSPVWLIATVFIAARGIIGMMQPTISAIIADLAPKGRLTESYALVRVGGNIGFALGPALGGYLMTFISYEWLIGIAALTCAFVTILVLFYLRESFEGSSERVDIRTAMAVANDHRFLLFNIFCLFLFASMGQLGSTLSVFSVDRLGFTTAQYGLMLTTNGIIVAISQYPIAIWLNRFHRDKGLILGSLLYAVGYLSLGWIKDFNWALVSIAIITAGEVTFSPIASSVVAESAPADRRGRYMGFFGLSQTIGGSFAPLLGGVLLDTFPTEARLIWGIIGLVGLIPAIGFIWWGRKNFKGKIVQQAPWH